MSTPRATMRLQFHRGFTFRDAAALAPYLARLGISHVYASPIMTARPGSMHGYDTVDPARINPELGGEAQFRHLVAELRRHRMGIVVDIVPNHMAIGAGNPWWMDVLSAGRGSRYAGYFDIDWEPVDRNLQGKVLLPVLGKPYGEALAAGEIRLHNDAGQTVVRYFDHVFPLADPAVHAAARSNPEWFDPATPGGRERLHDVLENQHYRLAWWRVANDEINWRRFFDINELAALRIEFDEVFEAVHAKMLALYAEGLIDGLRVDHIDGLAVPGDYCRKLRARLRELQTRRPADAPEGAAYLVVEKILSAGEQLPPEWQTDGTTGYDFMNEVSAVQHDAAGEAPLGALWHRISGRSAGFDAEEQLARRQILDRSFAALRESTVRALYVTLQSRLATRDISWSAIRRVLTEILANFPVYRVYARVGACSPADRAVLRHAVERAATTCLPVDRWLVDELGAWLGGKSIRGDDDTMQNVALTRFQQLSAPLCAKAVEDTAFYRYGRLISRNDVGFDVRQFAVSTAEFHARMQHRAAALPRAMLATATHDHKRGEDVRARLAVLSELHAEWASALEAWLAMSKPRCAVADGVQMPWPGDLAMLFQTIVGAWPMSLTIDDAQGRAVFAERIAAWQQKALREAKLFTDWSAPDERYEAAMARFIADLFAGPSELLHGLAAFAERIAPAGAINGLAQTILKATVPGVPDFYQGTEFWDLSLVDPDNRTPVDFAARQSALGGAPLERLVANWRDGRLKQFVIARLLALRKELPGPFEGGRYLPLRVQGAFADRIIAFARLAEKSAIVVVTCRSVAEVLEDRSLTLRPLRLAGTRIVLPPELTGMLRCEKISGRPIVAGNDIDVADLLAPLPFAVLTSADDLPSAL